MEVVVTAAEVGVQLVKLSSPLVWETGVESWSLWLQTTELRRCRLFQGTLDSIGRPSKLVHSPLAAHTE